LKSNYILISYHYAKKLPINGDRSGTLNAMGQEITLIFHFLGGDDALLLIGIKLTIDSGILKRIEAKQVKLEIPLK
jgi:hypothetical protein